MDASVDADWERIMEFLSPYGCMCSGALFGLAWWALVDAIVFAAVQSHLSISWKFFVPGIVATLAVILMTCTRRETVYGGQLGDEYEECRTRTFLLVVYMLSIGAVIASVVILFKSHPSELPVATSGVLNTGLVLGSGLLFWWSRSSSANNNYLY